MRIVLTFLLVVLAACGNLLDDNAPPPPPPPGTPTLALVNTFVHPVFLTTPPGDSARLFIVEQDGRIVIVRRDTTLARPFLDIRGTIDAGGEEGLLSLAFHPQYASNGRFYVYFTDSFSNIRVLRYNVSSDPDSADAASADTVLTVAHPGQTNHNGGQLQFGADGMLFIGTGDGGGAASARSVRTRAASCTSCS